MKLRDAENLALCLMDHHNLRADGWQFEFDRHKTRFGVCSYTRKIIGLSAVLTELNSETEIRDTILHEIAHALTPLAHHGRAWELMAISIGARPTACVNAQTAVLPASPYVGKCPSCNVEVKRYKLTRLMKRATAQHTACMRVGKPARVQWFKKVGSTLVPLTSNEDFETI